MDVRTLPGLTSEFANPEGGQRSKERYPHHMPNVKAPGNALSATGGLCVSV